MGVNYGVLFEYNDGCILFNTLGEGVVLLIPNSLVNCKHSVGDEWMFWFQEHNKVVKVEKVEDSFNSDLSPVELYFGNQFYDEEIQQMKDGFVDITKRNMKELCE